LNTIDEEAGKHGGLKILKDGAYGGDCVDLTRMTKDDDGCGAIRLCQQEIALSRSSDQVAAIRKASDWEEGHKKFIRSVDDHDYVVAIDLPSLSQ